MGKMTTWRDLKPLDSVKYSITEEGKTTEYEGVVAYVMDDHAIIMSDLIKTPAKKRKYDISMYIDDDFQELFTFHDIKDIITG